MDVFIATTILAAILTRVFLVALISTFGDTIEQGRYLSVAYPLLLMVISFILVKSMIILSDFLNRQVHLRRMRMRRGVEKAITGDLGMMEFF